MFCIKKTDFKKQHAQSFEVKFQLLKGRLGTGGESVAEPVCIGNPRQVNNQEETREEEPKNTEVRLTQIPCASQATCQCYQCLQETEREPQIP